MKNELELLIKELDGVDLVLEKLVTKSNTSVFEKLCANCDRIFNSFCEMSIIEIVKSGNAKLAIDFLTRLKGQVVRLKEYKEALSDYIEANYNMPSEQDIQDKATSINNEITKNKNLTLVNDEGKAA